MSDLAFPKPVHVDKERQGFRWSRYTGPPLTPPEEIQADLNQALAFPKPVHQPKERKGLRKVSKKKLANLRHKAQDVHGGSLAYDKPLTVINEALLRAYKGKPCGLCRSRKGTAAHHLIPRSEQRLDLPENICPACPVCNEKAEWDAPTALAFVALKSYEELASLYDKAPIAGLWKRIGRPQPVQEEPPNAVGPMEELP